MKSGIRFSVLVLILSLYSCYSNDGKRQVSVSMQEFQEWAEPSYRIEASKVRREIAALVADAGVKMYADQYTNSYYNQANDFVWITRHGVDDNADTLLSYLEDAKVHGLTSQSLHVEKIKLTLQLLRNREFSDIDVNKVMARLEFWLTQSYLRFAAGQRYGYVRPKKIFNNLLLDDTIANAPFRQLFDLPVEAATDSFYHLALAKVCQHQIGSFLRESQPSIPLYTQLQQAYAMALQSNDDERARLCRINMERARWRYPRPQGKYVWVNLAGFELTAVDEAKDTSFTMRVCGGDQKHKTPLLTSQIHLLQLNPYWIIPMTIIRKEIAPRHVGDTAYFTRNRYRIIDKETKEEVDPLLLSASQLTSGLYTIKQDNGEGNSLGRMIFRFPNNFAVYLHDTNNRGAFGRKVRAVSHGCIRLERPLDLAFFLMEKPDSIVQDKMRMAIDLAPKTQWGKRYLEANPEGEKMGNYTYPKSVPVFLDYYTLYPNPHGELEVHPDYYHYDEEIEKILLQF